MAPVERVSQRRRIVAFGSLPPPAAAEALLGSEIHTASAQAGTFEDDVRGFPAACKDTNREFPEALKSFPSQVRQFRVQSPGTSYSIIFGLLEFTA